METTAGREMKMVDGEINDGHINDTLRKRPIYNPLQFFQWNPDRAPEYIQACLADITDIFERIKQEFRK